MFWAAARPGNRAVAGGPGATAVAAWAAVVVWSASPYDRYLHHDAAHAGGLGVGAPVAAAVFVAGWVVMVGAMMLPTTYPVVALFDGLVRRRPDRGLLLALCVAGYVLVWAAFGLGAYVGDRGLHALVERVPAIDERAGLVGASVLALAGAYQFAPLKYRCLERCRSPRLFVLRHWTGRHRHRGALGLGLDSGLFCVGCCWSLMLLMFAVGAGSLPWMLGLAAVMAAEKNLPGGDRLGRPLGVGLLAAAAVAAAIALPGR